MAKLKGVAAKAKKKVQVLTEGKDVKLTHIYDPESLTSWRNVLVIEGTVFAQRAVLMVLVAQILTAAAVAGLVVHFSSNPERYNTRSIRDFVETLSISIGMLLGLFLRSCLARWWDTVKSLKYKAIHLYRYYDGWKDIDGDRAAKKACKEFSQLSKTNELAKAFMFWPEPDTRTG